MGPGHGYRARFTGRTGSRLPPSVPSTMQRPAVIKTSWPLVAMHSRLQLAMLASLPSASSSKEEDDVR